MAVKNLQKAVELDLVKFPINTWMREEGKVYHHYSHESLEYCLTLHPEFKVAYVDDLREFFSETQAKALYMFIDRQLVAHYSELARQEKELKKIRAKELFPNADLTKHVNQKDTVQNVLVIKKAREKALENRKQELLKQGYFSKRKTEIEAVYAQGTKYVENIIEVWYNPRGEEVDDLWAETIQEERDRKVYEAMHKYEDVD